MAHSEDGERGRDSYFSNMDKFSWTVYGRYPKYWERELHKIQVEYSSFVFTRFLLSSRRTMSGTFTVVGRSKAGSKSRHVLDCGRGCWGLIPPDSRTASISDTTTKRGVAIASLEDDTRKSNAWRPTSCQLAPSLKVPSTC